MRTWLPVWPIMVRMGPAADSRTAIWGAEFIGDYSGFERFGSILPIPRHRAVKGCRVAFALLDASGCDGRKSGIYKGRGSTAHTPVSSGMGRLFDGVAAILGIKTLCSHEGQGAVLLEAAAAEDEEVYPFALEGEPLRYDWRGTIRAIWPI